LRERNRDILESGSLSTQRDLTRRIERRDRNAARELFDPRFSFFGRNAGCEHSAAPIGFLLPVAPRENHAKDAFKIEDAGRPSCGRLADAVAENCLRFDPPTPPAL